MKNYLKAMSQKDSADFHYLASKIPKLSSAKLKEGIFFGPQIRDIRKRKTKA